MHCRNVFIFHSQHYKIMQTAVELFFPVNKYIEIYIVYDVAMKFVFVSKGIKRGAYFHSDHVKVQHDAQTLKIDDKPSRKMVHDECEV